MNTLILKKPDGTIERTDGEEASKILKRISGMSAMVIESMFGGIPLTTPEGKYVIEQSEHKYMVADFLREKTT